MAVTAQWTDRRCESLAVAALPLLEVTSGQMEQNNSNSCRFGPGRKEETAPEWLPRAPVSCPESTGQVSLPGECPEPKSLPCFRQPRLWIDSIPFCGQNRLHNLWIQCKIKTWAPCSKIENFEMATASHYLRSGLL